MDEWEKVLKGSILTPSPEGAVVEMETCPQCGKEAPVSELFRKRAVHIVTGSAPLEITKMAKIKASAL